jgi:GT2 family glycosyltransferase
MSSEPRTRTVLETAAAMTEPGQPSGRLEAVTFLGARFMLALVSGLAGDTENSLRAWLLVDQKSQRLSVSPVHDCDGDATTGQFLLLLSPAGKRMKLPPSGGLILETSDGVRVLEPSAIDRASVAPERFSARLLAGFDAGARAGLLERVLTLIAGRGGALADAAQALAMMHDSMRERLPATDASAEAECAARVEALWRVDRNCFYAEGWSLDRDLRLKSLRLLTPEGRRVAVLKRAFRYSRPDVCEFFGAPASEKLGFIAFIELPEESTSAVGWVLQAEQIDGAGFEVEVPSVLDQPLDLRTTILNDMQLDQSGDRPLMRDHIVPAMTRLQKRLSDAIEIEAIDQHGDPPDNPDATIVVPLYRRTEFLEHQLAQFVHDPEIHRADVIYVLDSPEDAGSLRTLAGQLFDLYGVPFRLAVLTGNGGFSTVNNLGASLATGRLLLMLNSDVLPSEPGWLSRMVEFYDAHPDIGALSPKLLYEDDSIQHAGLYFERVAGATSWSNEHFYKGMHRLFGAACEARPVPALTGACLLIDLELYRSLGGLRGVYVRGDYEDSDLCLRLREQGRARWYMAEVELYHLEGQSYPSVERDLASQYNQWLHSELWAESLSALESQR